LTHGAGDAPRTWKLELAYDGERYLGWQRQRQEPTVQGVVEEALARIGHPGASVIGAGRTDTGVHALRQVAHVRLVTALESDRLRAALNAHLPADVVVTRADPVSAEFHARYGVRRKRYAYGIRLAAVRSPFLDRRFWRLAATLDVPAMRVGAAFLRGRHDYSAFRGSLAGDKDPVRTIRHLHLVRRGERLWLVFQGDGFLYRMVRSIVGTLVEVGRGRWTPDDVRAMLASRDRQRAGPSAPAHGLYLLRASYVDPRERGPARLTPPAGGG